MTPTEYAGMRRWIVSRWPAARPWESPDDAAEIYQDFEPLPQDAVMDALKQWYRRGQAYPPVPSELVSATRLIIKTDLDRARAATPCVDLPGGHPWSIIEWDRDGDDTQRLVQCARCGRGPEWRSVHTPGEEQR